MKIYPKVEADQEQVIGTVESKSCWKGTSYELMMYWELQMRKLCNLESELKSYKVGYILDQEFQTNNSKNKKYYTRTRWCCCIPLCCCRHKMKYQTEEYIMTYEFGDPSKPLLVLIHGYAASSIMFFKTFNLLEKDYHVIALDLPGMGCSSRPHFRANNRQDAEEFFIQSIEKWRHKMDITNFTLIGHSFGGYVSAKYTLKHPESVK